MGTLLIILGTLFAALFIIVPLIERFGAKQSDQDINKIGRFIMPLIAVLLLVQAINYFFF